jgi:hypothetical protein
MVPATETKMLVDNGYGWVDGWISEGGGGGGIFWFTERVNNVQMVGQRLLLSERVSVGCGGQVSRLTNM